MCVSVMCTHTLTHVPVSIRMSVHSCVMNVFFCISLQLYIVYIHAQLSMHVSVCIVAQVRDCVCAHACVRE